MLSVKYKGHVTKVVFTDFANAGSECLGFGTYLMTDEAWLDPAKGPSDEEIAFDYIKSPDFKVVWADGAIGAITPNGIISVVLYAERAAIPRRQVYGVGPDGRLGEECQEKRISRGSIVREMACNLFLSQDGAENLARWLLEQVNELKTETANQDSRGEK